MKEIYDNAATTRVHPQVAEKMKDALVNNYGNPSSSHRLGIRAEQAIKEVRELIELDHGPWAMRMRFRIAKTVVATPIAAEGKEHRHIERAVDLIQILFCEVHLLRHEALHEAAGACFEFDTHGLPALAFFSCRSTSRQILCIFFIDRKIRVTCDAERMCFQRS